MSVYILGMEMPKETIKIILDPDGKAYQEVAYPMSGGFRLKPLGMALEVPTPHGRLIDADDVIKWTRPDEWGTPDER